MHAVLDQQGIYKWNGLTWVRVADLSGTLQRPQMIFLGQGPLQPAPTGGVHDDNDNWGMPLGTAPDPKRNNPDPGDIYIDTANDRISVLN
jgi:hypothetical protein